LHDNRGRVGEHGDHAEHDTQTGARSVLYRRQADHDAAGEGDGASSQQPAREAFTQEYPGEQGDQEGPGVDDHRRGAGVHQAFRRIEGGTVDAEEGNPVGRDRQ